jgi:hypothetical protein
LAFTSAKVLDVKADLVTAGRFTSGNDTSLSVPRGRGIVLAEEHVTAVAEAIGPGGYRLSALFATSIRPDEMRMAGSAARPPCGSLPQIGQGLCRTFDHRKVS